MPKANDRIGPYQLISKLGEGGFGEVWLAQDLSGSSSREVAVKMPLDTEIDLDALLQEATLWARATGHPNVLEFLAARVFDGQVVLVSEYAPDGSLKDWLKRHGGRAPSVEAAVEMTRGILAGLEHLHGRSIIHRDVKPDNVLLLGATPRLADFGISRVLKSDTYGTQVAGTLWYMAPEAFRRKRNQRTDLWSVGVILYHMLSGRLPFNGADLAELYGAIRDEEPEPLPAAIPEWLRQVSAKALIKDPEQRYQTAAEMRAALTPPPPKVEEKPVPPPRRTLTIDKQPPKPEPAVIEPQSPSHKPTVIVPRPPEREPTVDDLVENINGVKLVMVRVPGGEFQMGSPSNEQGHLEWEGPQHRVTVPGFYIGKYEVTQAQWKAVMGSGNNPSRFKGDDLPVENVSWNDAKDFCQKLSALTGKTYRLPSEAEWEYACRAKTTGAYAGNLDAMAWYSNNSGSETHPVGQKQANAFGLFDMHGNVWEWCEDHWQNSYNGAPTDGSAWVDISATGSDRVDRGGGWGIVAVYCRSAYRISGAPGIRYGYLGFRLVRIGR
jgi:formylglycine-generating enzyme required for sulfatase activity